MDPATLSLLISFATEFGIPAVLKIIALYEKPDVTVADVRAAFVLAHKDYSEYDATLDSDIAAKGK